MKRQTNLFFLPAIVAAGSFLFDPASWAETEARISLDGDTISYEGTLAGGGFERLARRYEASDEPIRWLRISSAGGEVNAAMDFGEWIFARRLNVRVYDRCLSSCANYVFTAGIVKVIEAGAIVAWHGSAIQSEEESRAAINEIIERDILPATSPETHSAVREKLMRETFDYLRRARDRQREFFAHIEVDEQITQIGNGRADVRDFWFLSVDTMAAFGVDHVVAPSDYANTDTQRFGDGRVTYIEPDGLRKGTPTSTGPERIE